MDRERFKRKGNLTDNDPDRPLGSTLTVYSVGARQIVGNETPVPLTPFQVVKGKTIGGGLSKEALRRARKNAARSPKT